MGFPRRQYWRELPSRPKVRISHRQSGCGQGLSPSSQQASCRGGAGLHVEGPEVGGAAGGSGKTHVDEMVSVSNEQVAQDAGFIEVPQADHVLHSVDRRRVHGLYVRGFLRGDPVFLRRCTWLTSACPPETQATLCQGRKPQIPATL